MERCKGYYSLLQYSPSPERQEFINIGVLLCVPEREFLRVKYAENFKRVERLFGPQDRSYINNIKKSIESRLMVEAHRFLDVEVLEKFCSLRANELRMTSLRSASVVDPLLYIEKLYCELVSDEPESKRGPILKSKLRSAFSSAGVIDLLDKPDVVELPEYGIRISAPFGYQNGHYNLIEPMRLDNNPSEALREAGRRAIEGQWLANISDNRLVVVGDFSGSREVFYRAVADVMKSHRVKLYSFEDMLPLIKDIKKSAPQHVS